MEITLNQSESVTYGSNSFKTFAFVKILSKNCEKMFEWWSAEFTEKVPIADLKRYFVPCNEVITFRWKFQTSDGQK